MEPLSNIGLAAGGRSGGGAVVRALPNDLKYVLSKPAPCTGK